MAFSTLPSNQFMRDVIACFPGLSARSSASETDQFAPAQQPPCLADLACGNIDSVLRQLAKAHDLTRNEVRDSLVDLAAIAGLARDTADIRSAVDAP